MPLDQEISELFAAAREQVLYLQELGVEGLSVELPEAYIVGAVLRRSEPPALAGGTARGVKNVRPDPGPFEPPRQPAKDAGGHPSFSSEGNVVSAPEDISAIREAKSRPPADAGGSDRAGRRLAALPSLGKRKPAVEKIEMATAKNVETAPAEAPAGAATKAASAEEALFGDVSKELPESSESMQDIWNDIGNCTRCPLFEGRTQIVHTTGNFDADLMFVGEAPGKDEDEKGEPFVGRAGQLLNKIIEAIGMTRGDVAIGNINRCRPPENRTPTLPEAHTCRPFLLREIAVIRPKVIVVMGNTALHNLLDTKVGITKVRGRFQDYYGVKVMPTFHPAYLLRDPSKKRETWEDMKMVRDFLSSLG